MRRAKIVATLGPASETPEVLEQLVLNGMDVARLNFSHGDHADHARTLERLRAACRHLVRPVAVLQDLQGPKIRTGPLQAGRAGVTLTAGEALTITTEGELKGTSQLLSTTYPYLAEDVKPGDRILIDDGLLELKVLTTDGVRLTARVIEGGLLGEHKGINLPGVALRTEAMSEKDKADLAFGLAAGVDLVALSFVRTPEDVRLCRSLMERAGRTVPVIAKIEKPEALDRIDEILAAADGLMVARGDLGVEILPERVPGLQKMLCHEANRVGKPVIVATQMLESMIEHPRPTRAEASDVANAVWDGADAVMLSGETASGRHPLLAVQMMDRIVREAEAETLAAPGASPDLGGAGQAPFNEVTAQAACRAAEATGAVAVVCFTISGTTPRLLARFRPRVPIIAFSPDQATRRRSAHYWGVLPRIMEPVKNADAMAEMVSERLLHDGLARPGDRLVLVFGSPVGVPGQTNSIRFHQIPRPGEQPQGPRYRVPI
jgi:pyruvate kinase